MCVINDLLGQTHRLDSSYHYSYLKVALFYRDFEKRVWTYRHHENSDPYRPWLWTASWINSTLYGVKQISIDNYCRRPSLSMIHSDRHSYELSHLMYCKYFSSLNKTKTYVRTQSSKSWIYCKIYSIRPSRLYFILYGQHSFFSDRFKVRFTIIIISRIWIPVSNSSYYMNVYSHQILKKF